MLPARASGGKCTGEAMSLRAELLRLSLRSLKRRARSEMTIEQVRQWLDDVTRYVPKPPRGTRVSRVDGGVGGVAVATPQSRADRHVLYLHGGAYCFGKPSHYRDFIWRIAAATGARVLCVDYRLAPEHPFPAALDDAVAAYRGLLAAGAAPSRIAIMGDSAGGGLTLATLLRLRDEGVGLPAAAVALSPWTDLALTGESYVGNAASDPMPAVRHVPGWARHYVAGADPRHPYASPLYGDPAGLPPTLIQVGSDEILRDDAVRMAERMRAAGCSVELEIWPRMPHVWQLFARIVPEGRWAVERIGAFVRGQMSDVR
ncbi:MAG TPA: alpha/beta hydrolase [Xanthobacteraceae bacterium]|jgi:acetyl esterase/lipase